MTAPKSLLNESDIEVENFGATTGITKDFKEVSYTTDSCCNTSKIIRENEDDTNVSIHIDDTDYYDADAIQELIELLTKVKNVLKSI